LGAPKREAPPDFPRASYADEDVNGPFPAAVYLKTRTQTFDTYHYYLLHDGRIWYKSIESEKEPRDWTLFGTPARSGLTSRAGPRRNGFSLTNAPPKTAPGRWASGTPRCSTTKILLATSITTERWK